MTAFPTQSAMVALVSAASVGDVATNGTIIVYTPSPNSSGQATFSYTVSDGAITASATVTVTINAINDPPQAVDDTVTTAEVRSVTFASLTNDFDPVG